MANSPVGLDGGGFVSVGSQFMGIFWYCYSKSVVRGTFVIDASIRLPDPSDVWRLRSTEALDGDHSTPSHHTLVLL